MKTQCSGHVGANKSTLQYTVSTDCNSGSCDLFSFRITSLSRVRQRSLAARGEKPLVGLIQPGPHSQQASPEAWRRLSLVQGCRYVAPRWRDGGEAHHPLCLHRLLLFFMRLNPASSTKLHSGFFPFNPIQTLFIRIDGVLLVLQQSTPTVSVECVSCESLLLPPSRGSLATKQESTVLKIWTIWDDQWSKRTNGCSLLWTPWLPGPQRTCWGWVVPLSCFLQEHGPSQIPSGITIWHFRSGSPSTTSS